MSAFTNFFQSGSGGGLLGGVASMIGAIGGIINGPKRQYRFQRKLMDRQAELNERAAENNQRRAMDMYNHQFQTQTDYNDEKITQANEYNSAASARARAEMAGLSKASLGASSASPAASSSMGGSPSASGAGTAAGSGLPSVDVMGYGRNLVDAGGAVSGAIRDISRIANENLLTESQSGLMKAQTALAAANELQTQASTSLINSQVVGQDTQNKILALQAEITEATKDTQIAMSTAQYVHLVSSAYQIYVETQGQLEKNRVFKKYGDRQAAAYLDKTLASITVAYAQANDLWSHAGLNKEMASLYGQLYLNAVNDGVLKKERAQYAAKIAKMEVTQLDAEISRLEQQIIRSKVLNRLDVERLKAEMKHMSRQEWAMFWNTFNDFVSTVTKASSALGSTSIPYAN